MMGVVVMMPRRRHYSGGGAVVRRRKLLSLQLHRTPTAAVSSAAVVSTHCIRRLVLSSALRADVGDCCCR